jgi:hypothetical protein
MPHRKIWGKKWGFPNPQTICQICSLFVKPANYLFNLFTICQTRKLFVKFVHYSSNLQTICQICSLFVKPANYLSNLFTICQTRKLFVKFDQLFVRILWNNCQIFELWIAHLRFKELNKCLLQLFFSALKTWTR